jgi:hypothetical protein
MKPLELNILFYAESNLELLQLGITTEQDYTVDKMTFYSINGICRNTDEEGKDYTSVFSNGEDFVCTDTYENVKWKILHNL